MLSILLIISKRKMVTAQELAEHFEVSVRTIYRDIDKIGEAGIPIASIGGKGGGYYLMDNYRIDSLFLNRTEAQSFMDVIQNLDFLFGRNTLFNDVILKFDNTFKEQQANTAKLKIDMSHLSMEQELKNILSLLNDAIEQTRLLVFDYMNRNMEDRQRIVEPLQIQFSSGHWHLIGFCRVRNDYRKFKLVRMGNVSMGEPFSKRPLDMNELREIFAESYQTSSISVTLKFTPRIGKHLIEHFDKESITEQADGSFLAEEKFPDDEGLIKFILGFGMDCEVLSPVELRKKILSFAENIFHLYND